MSAMDGTYWVVRVYSTSGMLHHKTPCTTETDARVLAFAERQTAGRVTISRRSPSLKQRDDGGAADKWASAWNFKRGSDGYHKVRAAYLAGIAYGRTGIVDVRAK